MGKKEQPQEQVKKTKPIVKDERFKRLNYDPKFKSVPQDMRKVKVDQRFAGMLTKKKFKVVAEVDKYGRKVKEQDQNKELKEYYQMEEEEPQEFQNGHHSVEQQEHENIHDWMENYNEESDTDSELEIEGLLDEEKQLWSDDEKVVKNQNVKVTKRLALCNYDWINIKTPDLMILFNSFKPASGFIEKIEVYQSDFGKQRMEQESIKGPADIWKNPEEDSIANTRKKILKKLFINDKKKTEETDIDMSKLRQYQKERMRYYYAVIYCDTKETAEGIYTLCDGKQFENSNSIDLRYIPSDLVFPRPPEEVCDKLPQKAGDIKNKVLRSVGHSHVTLSWEDPSIGTLNNLKKMNWGKMKEGEYKDIDWSLYIDDHLSEEEENNEGEQDQSMSEDEQQLMDEQDNDRYRRNNKKDRASNNQQQMQIIFSGGFDLAKKVKEKRQQETQKRQDKRDEKKIKDDKKKLSKRKQIKEVEQEQSESEEIAPEQKAKRIDHLELMVDKKHANKQFKPNVADPRFGDLYKNPNLQIDPTSSLFNPQKTGQIFKEVVKRAKNREQ